MDVGHSEARYVHRGAPPLRHTAGACIMTSRAAHREPQKTVTWLAGHFPEIVGVHSLPFLFDPAACHLRGVKIGICPADLWRNEGPLACLVYQIPADAKFSGNVRA